MAGEKLKVKRVLRYGWLRLWLVVILGCILIVLVSGCQSLEPSPVPLQMAILERDPWDTDVLPKQLQSDLVLESVRLIDKRNNRHYWLAYDEAGALCLIVGFGVGRPDWGSGRGCADVATFQKHGVTVSVSGVNHFTSAVLVPDGYTQSLVNTFPGQFVATNLVAFDSKAAMNGVVGEQQTIMVGSDLGDLPEVELLLIR